MERMSYQVRVGLKSNTTAVLMGRGKFGHRDIDTQGKGGHMKTEAETGSMLSQGTLGIARILP